MAKFSKHGIWDKVPEGSTVILGDTQIFLQQGVGLVEGSLYAKTQLDSSSRFDTIPACGGRTGGRTHDDSICRASIASRGKKSLAAYERGGMVRRAVLDVAAFERLLGPCMDVLKRNVVSYEQQLVQIFGSCALLRHDDDH